MFDKARRGLLASLCAIAAVALSGLGWPASASAAGGGATSPEDIGGVLMVVLIIAVAYISAQRFVDWLQAHLLVVSGLEYVLLGVVLGPIGLNAFSDLTGLLPIIALAAGWVGLLRGTDFNIATLQRAHPATLRVVVLHHFIPGLVVGLLSYQAILWVIPGADWTQAAIAGAVLGCCAGADSAEPLELLTRRYEIGDRIAPLLRQATRLGDILIIIAFGVIFCVFHQADESAKAQLSPAGWILVTFLMGAGLGLLFRPFLGGDESDNARFLALVGIIAFASGAAYFLELSPLAVNLALGMTLVLAPGGHLVHATLERTQKPMALVLMVFAGALWTPTDPGPTLLGLMILVALRTLGKAAGSVLAGWGRNLRTDLFKGLLAHGEVTVAMAVSYRLIFDGEVAEIAYAIILGSVLLHDLVGPRILRDLLVDEGDVQRELSDSITPAEVG